MKKLFARNKISGRTALLSAVPPELLHLIVQSLLSVCHCNVWLTSHLLAICNMTFRLKLVKCYSHEFTLQGSHHSPLTVNDNSCYFSSSSLFRIFYLAIILIYINLSCQEKFLVKSIKNFPYLKTDPIPLKQRTVENNHTLIRRIILKRLLLAILHGKALIL